MAKYIYGGAVLYEIPVHDGYEHAVIVYHEDTLGHNLILSNEPFKVIENRIAFPSDADYLVYTAPLNSSWYENSLNVEDGEAAYTAIPEGSVFKWCNHGITDTNNTVVYEATDPIPAANPPTITVWPVQGSYLLGDTPRPLVCEATTSDGGTLTYAWYRADNNAQVSSTNTYTPDISTTGTTEYYCIVTNTLNGTTDTIKSNTVRVVVGKSIHALSLYLGWLVGRKIAELRNPIPSHFFDSKNLQLTVYKDDGSLSYYFDEGTFNLDVTEVR